MKLEELTLFDLKNLTKILRGKHKLLLKHKIYNLCKYDLTVILRNSGLIDENQPRLLRVVSLEPDEDGEFLEFDYKPQKPFKRSYFKGSHRLKTPGDAKDEVVGDGARKPGFSIKHGSFTCIFE